MAKVLLLGYSRIAQRRVIPALLESEACQGIEIATKTGKPALHPKILRLHDSYEQALERFDGDVVYVSLPNQMHDAWVLSACRRGFHCVVDKPAVLCAATIEALDGITGCPNAPIVAESVVFQFHPAWKLLVNELGGAAEIRHANGAFVIPRLPASDFRMQSNLGGGVFYDMSAYALGVGRLVWGCSPEVLHVSGVTRQSGMVTGFCLQVDYGNGRTFQGRFSFGGEYENWVRMSGDNSWGELQRVFSIPPNLSTSVVGRRENKDWQCSVPPADSFGRFFEEFFADLAAGVQGDWYVKARNAFRDAELLRRKLDFMVGVND